MSETDIEWTKRAGTVGRTWNPTTGCDKISAGCGLPMSDDDQGEDGIGGCYACTMAKRLKAMGSAKYQNDGNPVTSGPGFGVTMHPDVLPEPLRWRKPSTVFVNSMSDLGHARITREFLTRVWAVMADTRQHTYQILTKRPRRMARILTDDCNCGAGHQSGVHFRSEMEWAATPHNPMYVPGLKHGLYHRMEWPLPNVWMGTSIELDKHTDRADDLRATPAVVRFISAEPLLGPLPSLDLTGIDWLIIGGESGPRSRPMHLDWVYELIGKARAAGTAVFVKQLGQRWAGTGKGGDWSTWPEDLRIREYPAGRTAVAA
ncbi:protein gp37 [Micromonospora pisi]|uniref:Protein gp37 n=1 Tax=Micromonospora pisi TaxID=589240 RepID=A0A495JWB0_9ACTN|nr:phage Gp37/Gp68 family protein [Micromonospora pisi]RKR92835.1 protein gp37 [Micromonospora pisi]